MCKRCKLKMFLFPIFLFFAIFYKLNAQESSQQNDSYFAFRPDPKLEAVSQAIPQTVDYFEDDSMFRPQQSNKKIANQNTYKNRSYFYYDQLLNEQQWQTDSNRYNNIQSNYYQPSDFSVFEQQTKKIQQHQSTTPYKKPYIKKQMPNLFDQYESPAFNW